MHPADVVVGVDTGIVNVFAAQAVAQPPPVVAFPPPPLPPVRAGIRLSNGFYHRVIGTNKTIAKFRRVETAVVREGVDLAGVPHAELWHRVAAYRGWVSEIPSLRRDLASDTVSGHLVYLAANPVQLDTRLRVAFGRERRRLRWKASIERQRGRDIILREFVRSFAEEGDLQVRYRQ